MTEQQGSRADRGVLKIVARVVVSVAMLTVIAHKIDMRAVWEIGRAANAFWIIVALMLAFAGRIFAAFRWYLLVHGSNPRVRFWRITRLVFTSTLFGMFLPGMLGADIIRVYGLAKSTSDLGLAFASILVERLLASTALIILVLVGLFFTPLDLPDVLFRVAQAGLLIIMAGSVAIMKSTPRTIGDRILDMLRLGLIKSWLHRIYKALDYYKTQPEIVAWSVFAAIGAVIFRIIPTIAIAVALGLEIQLVHFAVFLPLIAFATQLPISLGGLGVRETAFVTLFGLVGVSNEKAFTLSLLVYLVTVASAVPGAWFYAKGGISERAKDVSLN